jgi:CHAT domain-containing protein/Tfp pilus assembly protein PilF
MRLGFTIGLAFLWSCLPLQGMLCNDNDGWAQTAVDLKAVANGLNQLGIQQYRQGLRSEALATFQQVLAIRKQIRDIEGEATTLGNIGTVYLNLEQYSEALKYFQLSLSTRASTRGGFEEGITLNNIGLIYDNLGQYSKALEYYQRALVIHKKVGDRNEEVVTLNNIGVVYNNLGEYAKALEYYQQVLAIKQEDRDHILDFSLESAALNNIGLIYRSLKQYAEALEYYRQALEISDKFGDRTGEATTFNNIGVVYDELGQYSEALKYYQLALTSTKASGDRSGEGKTLNNIGYVMKAQSGLELAILYFKQSVIVRESIRKDLKKFSREEQQSYTHTIDDTYRTLADLLLQKGRVTEALQVLDLLKIQELEDYLKNVKGNDRTAQGIKLLAPEEAISRQLSAISFKKSSELNRRLASEIQKLPKSEINKVPDYLRKLPQGVVLIYPLILDDRLELIIFSTNILPINRTVKIKKAELEKLVTDFRSDLQDYSSIDVKDSGKKLYDLLIKPIESDLKLASTTTILYAPDGILRYIPLAALYDGNQWLIEKYRVNNLIAYSLFDPDSKPQAKLRIFAGAFGGKDNETRFRFSGLPATIPEVDHIATTFSNTTKLIEQEFTATTAKVKVVGQTIVHFATHAEFKSGNPLDSYVLFGDGSKVTLAEINEWQLKDVDLFVLSACQTGVGSLGNGSEILGFGYQVQRAGAKASIASLWTVSDGGTQLLIAAFYGNLQKQNVSMSTSLRAAQLSMIRQNPQKGEINYSHPYYWSAFVLIGNGL